MDFVLVDTDVFSFLLRGDTRGEPYKRHVEKKTIAVSFVTVGELYYGAFKRGWNLKSMATLEQRLKAAVIVPYDLEISKIYGRL